MSGGRVAALDQKRVRVRPMTAHTLTVMCGLPGSGKSTYAALHRPKAALLSADDIRLTRANPVLVYATLFAQAGVLLRRTDVVVDTCALNARNRHALYRIGRDAHAYVELVILCVPWAECKRRDARREQRAPVDWVAYCKQGLATLRSVPSEGWDCVTYVPGERPALALFG